MSTKLSLNETLLYIAEEAIKENFDTTTPLDEANLKKEYPQLNEPRAVFVTLNLNGQLRGCVGSLVARRSLFEDIVSNAKSAAFNDTRFKPLSLEEFNQISIELSLLSQPIPLEYSNIEDLKSKIDVGVDGVILNFKNHQATFLPQVWEQLPTFELFFEYLCQKAGVSLACLEEGALIYTYKVEKIK